MVDKNYAPNFEENFSKERQRSSSQIVMSVGFGG